MKKQYLILFTIVFALMGALFLASCAQPATSGGSAASSAEASASAAAEASASADASASAAADTSGADADGFKSIPATIPADHAGRTTDQCPTCHVEGGAAPAIPEDHFINGELDGNRLQCYTCHLSEA